jgi:1-acyl-sn-glycerol-3-phosphate acyltransferase
MKAAGMEWPYRLGWAFFRALFALVFRRKNLHPERVPGMGPCILASNHASYFDPPLVGSCISRQLSILARDSLFRFPVFGRVLRSWRAVPVDPQGGSAAGLKAIMDRLDKGGAVLIFPEGTRTRDGKLLPVRSGVGLAVIKSGAPVVPVRVWGSYEAYGKHHLLPRPRKLTVKFGYPLDFKSYHEEAARCSKSRLKEIYQEISQQIMQAIAALEPVEDKTRFP